MEKIKLDIIKFVLDKKYWEKTPRRFHYSGHLYKNSPFETDDSCGNCDGARCETCKKIFEEPHFEFVITVDKLEEILKQAGCTNEEDLKEIVYSDWIPKTKEFFYERPTEYELKERYPEFYKSLLKE